MKRFLRFSVFSCLLLLTAGMLLFSASAASFLPGDVNGDGTVGIGDASLVLQNSLFPKIYPVSYSESLDFDGDGAVNIRDVVRLIQYSMYPEDYPLVRAEAPASAGLAFVSNGDGTCYVSGIGECTDTGIVIPKKSPDGDTVTGIGEGAFSFCESLTSITIPNGVTSINDATFYYCFSLISVTIPDSVTSIGDNAFYVCEELNSINYSGTISQWNEITKAATWDSFTEYFRIFCSDGYFYHNY